MREHPRRPGGFRPSRRAGLTGALALLAAAFLLAPTEAARGEGGAPWEKKLGPALAQRLRGLRAEGRLGVVLPVSIRLALPGEGAPRPGSPRGGEGEGGVPGRGGSPPPGAEERRRAVALAVESFARWLRERGIDVTAVRTRAPVVGARLPAGRLEEVARRPEVVGVELDAEMQPLGR